MIKASGISLQQQTSDTPFLGFLPYMRSVSINFSAQGLKPNTILFPFFDGINVSAQCFPTTIITDAAGAVSGIFLIPDGLFTTGTKIFKLTNLSNPDAASDCVAVGTFTSSGQGVYDTGTLISTAAPEVTYSRSITPQEIVLSRQTTINPATTRFKDPIAQTFFVAGNANGVMMTKLDVYFKSRPATGNIPITAQIREVINGYPSDVILPYSTVTLYPKDVNPSDDASAVTQFVFPAPVYLKNNQEYCFVLLPAGNSNSYVVWTAVMGETVLGTNEIIDKQPNAGRLIISANGVSWAVDENRDIKFSLHRANFDTSVTGSLILKNQKIDFMILTNITRAITPGMVLTQVSSGAVGTVVFHDTIRGLAQVLVTSVATFTNGTVTYASGESATVVIDHRIINNISPLLPYLDFNNTDTTWEYKAYGSDATAPAGYSKLALTSQALIGNSAVFSYSYEKGTLALAATAGTLMLRGTLTSESDNVSPVIDVSKLALIISRNYLNNEKVKQFPVTAGTIGTSVASTAVTGTTTDFLTDVKPGGILRLTSGEIIGVVKSIETDTELTLTTNASITLATEQYVTIDNEAGSQGQALSKYITRPVSLPEGQVAEDLRVYLDAQMPGNSSIEVYAQLRSPLDPTPIADRPWTRMGIATNPQAAGYGDYIYTLFKSGTAVTAGDESTPAGGINVSDVYQYQTYVGFGTFAIKLILLSDDPSIIPTVQSMRAIAMQT